MPYTTEKTIRACHRRLLGALHGEGKVRFVSRILIGAKQSAKILNSKADTTFDMRAGTDVIDLMITRDLAMGTRDERVDAYIAKSADFARPMTGIPWASANTAE